MEREQSLKFMHDLLRALIARKGSDLFITAGFPPAMKVDGKVTPVSQQSLSPMWNALRLPGRFLRRLVCRRM